MLADHPFSQEPTMASETYPTDAQKKVIEVAEELMVKTMARYDVSHDAYHGQFTNDLPTI